MNMEKETYKKFADAHAPHSPLLKDCLNAFWIGGLICMIGQGLRDFYQHFCGMEEELAATLTSVTLIFIAVVLTALGLFDRIAKVAGAGTLVPITGFANAVVSPAIDSHADIAHLGATGYELDTSAFSDEDRAQVLQQVLEYREMEELLLKGDLYRTENPFNSNYFGFMLVSKDKNDALLTAYRRMGGDNNEVKYLKIFGLDKNKRYLIDGFDSAFKGSTLMNIGLPLKMRKGDFLTVKYKFKAI